VPIGKDIKMKLKLISDFTDYYDHHFDAEGDTFRRVTTDGLNRIEILDYLHQLEFTTPLCGTPLELASELEPDDKIVLHHDLYVHRGEGKTLSTMKEALKDFPETFATQFIPFNVPGTKPEVKALSWRYLQIGTEAFWLEYTSTEDWRSNVGDGDILLFFRDKTELFSDRQYDVLLKFKFPLFAVDFVPDGDKLYAVDFNIAPGVRGTGVEKLLSPKEAVKAIKTAYKLLKKEMK
jgi:hypothetical protein